MKRANSNPTGDPQHRVDSPERDSRRFLVSEADMPSEDIDHRVGKLEKSQIRIEASLEALTGQVSELARTFQGYAQNQDTALTRLESYIMRNAKTNWQSVFAGLSVLGVVFGFMLSAYLSKVEKLDDVIVTIRERLSRLESASD